MDYGKWLAFLIGPNNQKNIPSPDKKATLVRTL